MPTFRRFIVNFRQLISFLSAIFLGLSSAGVQAQKSTLQMESAILLREDGTPRCRIGKNPSEYLTAEKLDDSAGLDALRECDRGDELYAISVFGSEEISLGVVVPPVAKVWLISTAIGGTTGCALTVFNKWLSSKDVGDATTLGQALITFAGGFGGTVISPMLLSAAIIPENMGGVIIGGVAGGLVLSIFSTGVGIIACDNL